MFFFLFSSPLDENELVCVPSLVVLLNMTGGLLMQYDFGRI